MNIKKLAIIVYRYWTGGHITDEQYNMAYKKAKKQGVDLYLYILDNWEELGKI